MPHSTRVARPGARLRFTATLLALALLLTGSWSLAQGALAGSYSDGRLLVTIQTAAGQYSGEIHLDGQTYPFSAQGTPERIDGAFAVGAERFPFSAGLQGDVLVLSTGGATYHLARRDPAARGRATAARASAARPRAGPIGAALWPEADAGKVRSNLNVQLNGLRRALQPWGSTTYLEDVQLTRCERDLAALAGRTRVRAAAHPRTPNALSSCQRTRHQCDTTRKRVTIHRPSPPAARSGSNQATSPSLAYMRHMGASSLPQRGSVWAPRRSSAASRSIRSRTSDGVEPRQKVAPSLLPARSSSWLSGASLQAG